MLEFSGFADLTSCLEMELPQRKSYLYQGHETSNKATYDTEVLFKLLVVLSETSASVIIDSTS